MSAFARSSLFPLSFLHRPTSFARKEDSSVLSLSRRNTRTATISSSEKDSSCSSRGSRKYSSRSMEKDLSAKPQHLSSSQGTGSNISQCQHQFKDLSQLSMSQSMSTAASQPGELSCNRTCHREARQQKMLMLQGFAGTSKTKEPSLSRKDRNPFLNSQSSAVASTVSTLSASRTSSRGLNAKQILAPKGPTPMNREAELCTPKCNMEGMKRRFRTLTTPRNHFKEGESAMRRSMELARIVETPGRMREMISSMLESTFAEKMSSLQEKESHLQQAMQGFESVIGRAHEELASKNCLHDREDQRAEGDLVGAGSIVNELQARLELVDSAHIECMKYKEQLEGRLRDRDIKEKQFDVHIEKAQNEIDQGVERAKADISTSIEASKNLSRDFKSEVSKATEALSEHQDWLHAKSKSIEESNVRLASLAAGAEKSLVKAATLADSTIEKIKRAGDDLVQLTMPLLRNPVAELVMNCICQITTKAPSSDLPNLHPSDVVPLVGQGEVAKSMEDLKCQRLESSSNTGPTLQQDKENIQTAVLKEKEAIPTEGTDTGDSKGELSLVPGKRSRKRPKTTSKSNRCTTIRRSKRLQAKSVSCFATYTHLVTPARKKKRKVEDVNQSCDTFKYNEAEDATKKLGHKKPRHRLKRRNYGQKRSNISLVSDDCFEFL